MNLIAPLGVCLGGSFCGFLRAVWGVFCPASPAPPKARCGISFSGRDLWGCAFNAWGLLQDIPKACFGWGLYFRCLAIVRFSAALCDFGGVGVGCACLPCIHLEVALFKLCPLSTCVAPWRAWGCGVCLRVVWGLFLPFCGLFLGWGVCVPACLLCLHPEHLRCARFH